jgi:hypothetical protein
MRTKIDPVVTELINWVLFENSQPIRAKEQKPEMNTRTDSLIFEEMKDGQNDRTWSGTISAASPA